jgi:tetratricopeptide (TPR) repeat protein
MPWVFISHSSLDREIVKREIISPLQAHGVDTWYSTEDIQTTSEWERQIRNALTKCEWFLVVLSPRSVESAWVRREVHWAVMKRTNKIITVMLENCEPEDLHLGLLPIQYIDFREGNKEALERLLAVWGLDKASQVKSLYRVAQDHIVKEEWASAVEKFEAVLLLDPTHSQSREGLENIRRQQYLASTYEDGVTAVREKRWYEALEKLQQISQVDDGYKDVQELIAVVGVELEKEKAERLFDQALEASWRHEWAKAVELYQAVLKITPSHELAQSRLARALQQKELAELYAAGRAHMDAGRWAEALKLFRRVRSIDRRYKDVSEWIADADAAVAEEEEQRSKKEALERSQGIKRHQQVQNIPTVKARRSSDNKVLRTAGGGASLPVAQKLRLAMKGVLFTIFKISGFIIGLCVVIWLGSFVVQGIEAALNNRNGDEFYAQQRYAEAEVLYRKAVEISPNDADYRNDLGKALSEQQKYGEAEVEHRKAVELSPGDARHHDKLGEALRGQKKYGEAEIECRKAVELYPNYDGYHNNLGASLYAQGKYEEAESEFSKAIELNPNYADYHYNLGLTLRHQGRLEEETAAYKRALEIDPNNENAKRMLKLK